MKKLILLFIVTVLAFLSVNAQQFDTENLISADGYTVDDSNPLITNASQFSSPYSQSDLGSADGGNLTDGVLIDEDSGTFWHSYWQGGSVAGGSHYFQVEMTDDLDPTDLIAFVFTRRGNADNDHTTDWTVMGTDDPEASKSECEEVAYIETPFGSKMETLMSTTFERSSYKYLRFYSETQYPSTRGYFHLSEFNIFPAKIQNTVSDAPALSMDDFTIEAGGTKQVTLDLIQGVQKKAIGFQCEFDLPEGLTIKGDPTAVEGTLIDRNGYSANLISNYKNSTFVIYNDRNLPFKETAKEIAIFTFAAAEDFSGGTITIKNIVFSLEGNLKEVQEDVTTIVTSVNSPQPQTDAPALSMDDFTIEPGGTKQVTLDLIQDGQKKILAFQCELELPEGLTVQGKPKPVEGTLTDEFGDSTKPSVSYSNGKMVVYNSNGLTFNETAKEIVTITFAAAEDFSGGTITIKNITFSLEGNIQEVQEDITTNVTSDKSPQTNVPRLSIEDFTIEPGETKQVTLDLIQDGQKIIKAFQCEFELPTGLTVQGKPKAVEGTMTDWDGYSTEPTAAYDSATRVLVVYSADGLTFNETAKEIVTITFAAADTFAGGTITIKNIIFSLEGNLKEVQDNVTTRAITEMVTITAENKSREYGENNPELTYTTKGAELVGTPSLNCSATKTSPVGEYPIVASQGSIQNTDVKFVNGTLTVTKAPLTIAVKSVTKKQGEAMPTFEFTYSGFKNGETEAVLIQKPTATCSATEGSPKGTYDINVSGAEAQNYEITYEKGTLTVEDAPIVTITADDKSRQYGEENPPFTFTSEGATLEGTPSLTCEATVTSSVGTYPIVASKGSVKNYNDHYVNGTLTVTKAPLTIAVKSVTKKQGEAMPTFEFTYTGFKNGETEAVLSQKPTATCSATEGSPKGTYDITVDGAVAQNYEITYEDGTLTVVDADMITITADDKSRQYGEENPTFTFTYEGATLDGTPSLTCAATETSSVGTYPIVASKGSVKNYNDHYVNGTLTITKAPLTITVQSTTKKVGEAMPPFELSYSGFKNGETVAVLTKKPTVTCSATADSPIGNYDIIVSGAEAENYAISYVNGTLTVLDDDEVVVVSADNKSREYGEVNPELTYKSIGIAFEGTPVLSCEATATSPVGEYDIVVEKGSISADNPRLINGTLTVTKAPLTITVTEVSKPKGAPIPEFTVTYSGFKNGETEATEGVFTKMPVISCNANADSPVGTYQITVSGAEATNYDITYVNGLLSVYSDLVVVMAENKSREYGEKNPELTYTSAGYELTGEPSLTCEATETSPVGGHYDIVVSRGSVTNYDLSTVNGSLTVTAAPLTIAVNPASKKQGEPMPDFTVTYSGFKNGETAETALQGELNFLCDATKDSPDGQYDIIASGLTAQNYDITFVKGVLTVTEDPLVVVTAGSYTVEYGEPLPTLGYTPEGAELVGTPSIACEAVQGSPAGTYYITITRGSVTNYNAQFVNGTLTITQAPLRVKAQDVTRYELEENPALALSYSGWKMDDDEGALTKLPVASTVADANSLPGVYDITVSSGEARNYELSYEKGTLTVHALPNNVVPYQDMSFQFPDEQVHEVKLLAVKAVQHAVIPTSISFRGAEWTVTAVADSALAGQEQLVTVEVPATVTTVGKDVFDGCSHLAAIMWRAPVKMTSTMMGQYSNPNLLLYVTDKTNALEGVTNVIDLNSLTAERIVLTDDGSTNDFYCPAAFTANEISYTHDYQQHTKSGSSQGWETLALPFDVAAMSHEQKGTIQPFGALTDTQISNGARPFWLYQFTETFGFREADAIRANTPYIISMPNEEGLWQGFILKGKVTFSGTNVKVRATSEAVGVQRGNRTLTPNYQRAEATDVYVLNVGEAYDGYAEGSVFTKGHRGTHPFEAYFTTTSDVKAFGVFDELADGIWIINNERLKMKNGAGAVYDMQGRKIVNRATTDRKLPKGLYIVNGKKVSVKE